MKRKLVVLSGAGVSAESGIRTFRDSDGLWENFKVEDVASIDGWYRNPEVVINFYNERRVQLADVVPNHAHRIIAELENLYDVVVVTQNVDDLHERAGSTNIIHLHGELTKICPEDNKSLITDIGYSKINYGDCDDRGVQMRPFIVWFGEDVPLINRAIQEVQSADILLVIGTSLNVYPAASLVYYIKPGTPIYLIDPKAVNINIPNVVQIQETATAGMRKLYDILSESEI